MLMLPLLLFHILRFATCDCVPASALALPVTEVLLSNGHSMRGILSSVGTPAQNMSFYPQVVSKTKVLVTSKIEADHTSRVQVLNDTWLYNTTAGFCDALSANNAQCVTLRGGLYNVSASTTAKSAIDVYAAGADASDMQPPVDGSKSISLGTWVDDSFSLGNDTLTGYPIGMVGIGFAGPYITQVRHILLPAYKQLTERVSRILVSAQIQPCCRHCKLLGISPPARTHGGGGSMVHRPRWTGLLCLVGTTLRKQPDRITASRCNQARGSARVACTSAYWI